MSFKTWLIKPVIKGSLLGGLTVFIGVLSTIVGLVTDTTSRAILLIVIGILVLAYLVLTIFYGTYEVNYIARTKRLEYQNETFEYAMISLISIFQQSARNANKLIHEIVDNGKINLNSWNFDLASTLVCEKTYNMLCKLDKDSSDFAVGYIRLDESNVADQVIYMNAYANRTMTQPTVFLKKRKVNDPKAYYDARLFSNNIADIQILMDETEIAGAFEYRTRESRDESKKYTQYIGIPVLCDKESGSKMVGLLEIVCLNGHKLSTDKSTVKEMVEKYFVPYAQLLLLLHKLEKALLAVPSETKR